MSVWVTSDLHLQHTNIIKYNNRPFINNGFCDVVSMNNRIIDNINENVKENDTLYILGDYCWGDPEPHLKRIICKNLHFVIGSHDDKMWNYKHYFKTFAPKIVTNICGVSITMNHEPMLMWHKSHYGSHHWFGHCHTVKHYHLRSNDEIITDFDKIFYHSKSIDVGVDGNNFMPWNAEELIAICNKKKGYLIRNHDYT